ncbi:MAG TPA: aminotransferase class IV [Spirochaetota bacterium]|nr:aminotransferase class IV [Spirochaetota bacterium]
MNASRLALFGTHNPIDLESVVTPRIPPKAGIFKCRVVYSERIESVEIIPYVRKAVSSLKIVHADDLDYSHKYSDRNPLNLLFERRGDCDDILIIKNGFVTDTSFSNVAFLDRGRWVTPCSYILAGTRRAGLLAAGGLFRGPVRIGDIHRFSTVCLINAMLEPGEVSIDTRDIIA